MCNVKDAVVLVIDDCEDNLFLMEMVLLQDGYKVETASCGAEGIKKIHQLVPDLIILDMMMPDMTGLEVVEHIKPYKDLARIPILLCTANRFIQQKDVDRIEEINDICYKPYDIGEIIAKINSLIACCDFGSTPILTVKTNHNNLLIREYRQPLDNINGDRNLFLATLENTEHELILR